MVSDFVIVYDTKLSKAEKQASDKSVTISVKSEHEGSESDSKEHGKERIRTTFLNNIRAIGLETEEVMNLGKMTEADYSI